MLRRDGDAVGGLPGDVGRRARRRAPSACRARSGTCRCPRARARCRRRSCWVRLLLRGGRRGRPCSTKRRRPRSSRWSQRIWTSPASDWSSIRPRPSPVSHSRPEAPVISAEPVWPRSAPDGNRLLVNGDAGGDAVRRVRRERVLDRLVERLRRRRRAAAARGDGDRRSCRSASGADGDDEGDQATG